MFPEKQHGTKIKWCNREQSITSEAVVEDGKSQLPKVSEEIKYYLGVFKTEPTATISPPTHFTTQTKQSAGLKWMHEYITDTQQGCGMTANRNTSSEDTTRFKWVCLQVLCPIFLIIAVLGKLFKRIRYHGPLRQSLIKTPYTRTYSIIKKKIFILNINWVNLELGDIIKLIIKHFC